MSVAYDLDPAAFLPQPGVAPRRPLHLVPPPAGVPAVPALRPGRRPAATSVAVLRPLHDPAPLRLTRRGVVVLGLALAVVGLAVVVLGALSARTAAPVTAGPRVVTVQAGDTLWSIASHAAPGQDPRAEIATIDRLNALHGASLVPGQRLRVR